MTARIKRIAQPATYQDLLALPDTVIGEILAGELYATPRPRVGHARASSVLGIELGGPFDSGRGGPGGWWILFEPELHLGADVLVPDLAGWRRERMPRPPPPSEPFITLAPDFVCEVLSPSTAALDYEKKLPIYAREEVGHVWFVHPDMHTLEVFRLTPTGWTLAAAFSGWNKIRAEPFDAIELELGMLWWDDRGT